MKIGEQIFWQVVGIGVGVSEEEGDVRESMVSPSALRRRLPIGR